MNHYKLISKLKTLKKQSQRKVQIAGDSNQDPVVIGSQSRGVDELPSRTPGSDTALGDTGNGRIPTTETPLKSPNDPITISKDAYLKSLRNKTKQKNNSYGKENTNSKSPDPSPTFVEQSLAREYNSKGIYFKSNLNAVNKRDDAGNITLTVGETNGSK